MPEVSSDEPEQVRGKTRVRPPRSGLPNSGEEAMALIKRHPLPPSYIEVTDDKERRKEANLAESTLTPIRRQAAPVDKAKAETRQPETAARTLTPARQAGEEALRERQMRDGSVGRALIRRNHHLK